MCDWETEVKMLANEVAAREAELAEYKVELEYALLMRDNAATGDES